jgi:hypothetical protein
MEVENIVEIWVVYLSCASEQHIYKFYHTHEEAASCTVDDYPGWLVTLNRRWAICINEQYFLLDERQGGTPIRFDESHLPPGIKACIVDYN